MGNIVVVVGYIMRNSSNCVTVLLSFALFGGNGGEY